MVARFESADLGSALQRVINVMGTMGFVTERVVEYEGTSIILLSDGRTRASLAVGGTEEHLLVAVVFTGTDPAAVTGHASRVKGAL